MSRQPALFVSLVALLAAGAVGHGAVPQALRPAQNQDALVPVVWLEAVPAAQDGTPGVSRDAASVPLLRKIAATDPRVGQCEKMIDNEPARFMRRLVAYAWRVHGKPATWRGELAIQLKQGGNNAAMGFRLVTPNGVEDHADVPFIILEADAESLSGTLLHEGGHLLHSIATHGRRARTWWSTGPHTTFAVTDPLTALAEGYAIHFEALMGHYGSDSARRAFYNRLAPQFDARGTRRAEFFAPVADLMTFSQTWARYQGVREGLPAFAGHVYAGDYLRSQFDPARDRAVLKPANAMISSEGVVASALFWTVAGLAGEAGAKSGGGLEQPGLVQAEQVLLAAFAALPEPRTQDFRPDVLDLVAALGPAGSAGRRYGVSRFIDLTRAVTARPDLRSRWHAFYESGLSLDLPQANAIFAEMEKVRVEVLTAALADPATLRAGVGPILPVRVGGVKFELKALGEPFELEYDLNALTEAELAATPKADVPMRALILRELDRAPFASVADFEQRAGHTLADLGLTVIRPDEPGSTAHGTR
jgi:hypothetical protein